MSRTRHRFSDLPDEPDPEQPPMEELVSLPMAAAVDALCQLKQIQARQQANGWDAQTLETTIATANLSPSERRVLDALGKRLDEVYATAGPWGIRC